MKRAAVSFAVLMPQSAAAECLGQGCYDGLATLLGLFITYCVAVVVLVVLLFLRRWRAAKVLGGILGIIAVAVFFMI